MPAQPASPQHGRRRDVRSRAWPACIAMAVAMLAVAGCGGSDGSASGSRASTTGRTSTSRTASIPQTPAQRALARDQQALVDAWLPATERVSVVWAAYSLFVDGLAPAGRLRGAVVESQHALAPVRGRLLAARGDRRLRGARTHLLRADAARMDALAAVLRSEAARKSGNPAGAAQGLLAFADRWNASLAETRLATTQVLSLDRDARVPRIREDALR